MNLSKTDVGGSNRGTKGLPRKECEGLPELHRRGNRMQAMVRLAKMTANPEK
jgi:hypothetical protein